MIRIFCCLLLVSLASCQLSGSKCYGDLGCMELNSKWYHPIRRPVNLFPLPREIIDTKFLLYTRNNTLEGQTLKPQCDDVVKSNFDAKKQTKLIIHGFIDNTKLTSWIKEMRLKLLQRLDVNAFVVDWDKAALPPYTQATANTRLVGREIAFFINCLKEKYGLNPADVHIIGHSLGAHIAGYAGEKIPGLGRITGLDPAGPYFGGMGTHVRLDPTDAKFVDVIHTDGTTIGYGMSEPCGHMDFYPNNGKQQPGCDVTETFLPLALIKENSEDAARVAVACNHVRAVRFPEVQRLSFMMELVVGTAPRHDTVTPPCPFSEMEVKLKGDTVGEPYTITAWSGRMVTAQYKTYIDNSSLFIESIDSQCPYLGHRCSDYQMLLKGECFAASDKTSDSAVMGLRARKVDSPPLTKYYFLTSGEAPYCRYHYRVTLDLAKPSKAENTIQGQIKITLQGAKATREIDLTPSGPEKFQHGKRRVFLNTDSVDIGPVHKADIRWRRNVNVLSPSSLISCALGCSDHLYIRSMKVDVASEDTARGGELSRTLCPASGDYVDLTSTGSVTLFDQCTKPA